MNVGTNIIKLPANIILANIRVVIYSRNSGVMTNKTSVETADDLEAFEEGLQEIDINVELIKDEKDPLKNTIRANRQAFWYGSGRLGRANSNIMTIDTGAAPPFPKLLTVRLLEAGGLSMRP